MSTVRYYFNVSFDWQNKERSYSCVLMAGKKPVCGISSGDFETVRNWVNRKCKQCGSTIKIKPFMEA